MNFYINRDGKYIHADGVEFHTQLAEMILDRSPYLKGLFEKSGKSYINPYTGDSCISYTGVIATRLTDAENNSDIPTSKAYRLTCPSGYYTNTDNYISYDITRGDLITIYWNGSYIQLKVNGEMVRSASSEFTPRVYFGLNSKTVSANTNVLTLKNLKQIKV